MESALLDRHPRLRNRRLQQLAGRLGDLYGAIKALSLNVRKWERQVNNVHKCVVVHERWISHAQRQIVQVRSQVEVLEAEYFSLNEED